MEPTPDLAAAAAAGSVGIQGGEQRASHTATVPRTQGQLSRGPLADPWEASFSLPRRAALGRSPPSPRFAPSHGRPGWRANGEEPCCHFPVSPHHPDAHLYLADHGWPIHYATKKPLSFREPSGEDGPSSLSPGPCPSGPDPGQVHAVAVAWDPLAPAAASSGPRQQQSGSHVCGRMERLWGDPSGGLGWAKWVLVLPRATHTCKDRGLTPPVASCPRATSPTGSNPHG